MTAAPDPAILGRSHRGGLSCPGPFRRRRASTRPRRSPWRQQPYLGETVCGDALFVETDRKDGALQVLLLDVVNHGPETAPTIGFVEEKCLRESAFENRGPADLLTLLHNRLRPHWAMTTNHVVGTAVHVDATDGSLRGCGVGDISDLWLGRPGGGAWRTHAVNGPGLLGPPHEYPFTENHRPFPDGLWVLVFTDGVDTAGRARPFRPSLPTFLTALPAGLVPADLLDRLWQTLHGHVGAAWPDDDVTALVLHRDEKNDSPARIPSGPPENSPHDDRDTP